MIGSDTSIDTEVEVFPGRSPCRAVGLPVDPPSLPVSPIVLDSSDDSVAVQVGSSREESYVLSGIVGIGSPLTAVEDAALFAVAIGGIPVAGFTVGTGCSSPARRD